MHLQASSAGKGWTGNSFSYLLIVKFLNLENILVMKVSCAVLITDFPPNITRHPMSGRILIGLSHTLVCSATGSGTLKFFWERSFNGSSWTIVSDDNTTSYTTDTTLAVGKYMYRCNVSNEAGSVVSNNATVIVYGEFFDFVLHPAHNSRTLYNYP